VSIDYGEMERQFLATLKADTGRSLEEWMAAISAQGLAHRNDTIDWLRRQGFMFSKASWLERIHNNDGKPLYGEGGSRRPAAPPRKERPPERPPVAAATPAAPLRPVPAEPAAVAPLPPSPSPPDRMPVAASDSDPAAIEALIARAKAYRPLAAFLIAEIRKIHPTAAVRAEETHLAFHQAGSVLAVLLISPRELRLGLALKDGPAPSPLVPAKLPAVVRAPAISHAAVLTDARQLTPQLRDAIRAAAAPPA